ncbi:MAG: sigma-54 dependent transcriptional regulator [Ignavibacteria bacterium]
MKKIFIIDDETEMLNSLEKILSTREDFVITKENNSQSALSKLSENEFDLIITDLKMQVISGLDIVKKTKEGLPNAQVIVISGYGTIEASVEAVKYGAFDFVEKPFTSRKLFNCIDRALKSGGEVSDDEHENINGIIFKSDKMKKVLEQVRKVAKNDMNILIIGESGSGKELIAREIHNISKGDKEPFVPVNCGALPEHLFESELFGHEKGAFTGALNTKPGLLEFANNGTFFFDEIGDMSQALQVKLLRMLEEKKIRRVGGQKEIEINVRIIAATNQDLEKLVNENRFRQDLYYRLNTFTLEIPPLRDRKDDILPLVFDFMNELCRKNSKVIREFSPDAKEALLNYSWPGNVRELRNVISRSYFLCTNNIIQVSDLPSNIVEKSVSFDENILALNYKEAKESVIEKFELQYLTYYLKKNKGNISQTAEDCGIDRRSIHRLINKYNIVFED